MKKSLIALLVGCVVAFSSTGCKKEATVDTAKLQSAFSGAPAEIKELVDKSVAAIKANDFKTAISTLDTVLGKSNELGQAQLDAVGEAFVLANVILQERGAAISAAEAKANADKLKAQAQGSQ